MLELIQLADIDACGGLLPIVKVIRNGLFPIVYAIIPIILILYAVIDFGKAVLGDEKELSKAVKKFTIRYESTDGQPNLPQPDKYGYRVSYVAYNNGNSWLVEVYLQ